MKIKNSKKGSTLLEALIALAAIVVILAGTSALVITSLNNSTFSRNQNQSAKLAQQGLEYIRDEIVNNGKFSVYSNFDGISCMRELDSEQIFTNTVCADNEPLDIIDERYRREVIFTANAPDCGQGNDALKATITVYWQSGKCTLDNPFCHSQQVSSCFSDPYAGSTFP